MINEKLLTQEQLKEKRKPIEEEKSKKRKKEEEAINRIFTTPDGKLLGKWLIRECGFLLPSTVSNLQGEILPNSTIYNEAKRGIYLELRKFFNSETLINLETNEE
jgi:hypothetical protein